LKDIIAYAVIKKILIVKDCEYGIMKLAKPGTITGRQTNTC